MNAIAFGGAWSCPAARLLPLGPAVFIKHRAPLRPVPGAIAPMTADPSRIPVRQATLHRTLIDGL